MRSRTLARLALGLSLTIALSGAASAADAASSPSPAPAFHKLVAPIGGTDGAPSARLAPGASDSTSSSDSVEAATDLSIPDVDWTAFQTLNLARLGQGAPPVIRHGSLDAIARDWASSEAASGSTELAPDEYLASRVPAGAVDGLQAIYSWRSTDVGTFLQKVEDALEEDGSLQANFTDSGIAIVQSQYGLWAYVLLAEYPHSTPAAGEMPFYRFYRPGTGTHFYSTSVAERNAVIGYPEYRYEGLVAYIKAPGTSGASLQDLNRFQLKGAGTHFYTANAAEYNQVLTFPQYSLDGVAGRVSAAPGTGLSPMHRFFRPASGTHFYTANPDEVALVQTLPGYTYEGVAFYLRVAS
ncbi:hypothetical protein [Cellulomonas sp. URHB0016]